jgi:NifU-like protein involved in Fe-S cluster formation
VALYSDVIRERFRKPRFRGRLEAPDAVYEDVNPLCGDRIRVEARLKDGRLTDARYSGDSCAIAGAAADVLVELALDRTVDEVQSLRIGDVLERLESDIRPSRMKCVALPLGVLHAALAPNARRQES